MKLQYTTLVGNANEAYLVAMLAVQHGWDVYSNRQSDWDGWLHLDLNVDSRYLTGASVKPHRSEEVPLDKFLEIIATAPRSTNIVVNNRDVRITPYGDFFTIVGVRVPSEVGLKLISKLVPRGTGYTNDARYLSFQFRDSEELRLAVAAVPKKDWNIAEATANHWSHYTMLSFDLLDRSAWGDRTTDVGPARKIVPGNTLLRFLESPVVYEKFEMPEIGYTAQIAPDKGHVIIGCQTFTAEDALEIAKHLKAPERVKSLVNESHNPQKVPVESLDEGMRFLDKDEAGATFKKFKRLTALYQWSNGVWEPNKVGKADTLTYATRLTRAQLRELRGLPPETPVRPIHNPRGVASELLPQGHRFLDEDEVGEEFAKTPAVQEIFSWYNNQMDDGTNNGNASGVTYSTTLTRAELRSKRGLPPEVPAGVPAEAGLHNPNNLTPEVYGAADGWRLLEVDEVYPRSRLAQNTEHWSTVERRWIAHNYINNASLTYRTKQTKEELAMVDRRP